MNNTVFLKGKDFQLYIDFHLYSLSFHSTNSRQKTETLITVLLITRQVFLLSAMKFEKNFKQWQKQYEIGFLKKFSLVDFSMSLLPHKQFIFKICCDSHNNFICFMSLRQSIIPCSNIYWIRGLFVHTILNTKRYIYTQKRLFPD